MTADTVIELAARTMSTAFWVTLPILAIGLGIGLLVAIFQAATQIQESSLAFLPKLIGVAFGLLLFGPWVLDKLTTFTTALLAGVATAGR
jgi:flagellar biosynthesis protein FliQ